MSRVAEENADQVLENNADQLQIGWVMASGPAALPSSALSVIAFKSVD
jgi:hypothetical protein